MCDRYSYILPDSSLKSHRKRRKVINITIFHMLNLVVQNGVGLRKMNVKDIIFRLQRRRQQKHRQNAYYGPQRFAT